MYLNDYMKLCVFLGAPMSRADTKDFKCFQQGEK